MTSPLVVVVLIVLVDLMGFSIVMPLLPRFADDYGFSEIQIGVLLAAFPMLQLIAGPILGRLSDRLGRRPVLIFSQAGTALSFVILAFSKTYWVMLLARMLDGASGGNFLVAQAYIADVTKPEDRARSLGMLGAAFGLGFVIGPLLSGLMLSESLPIGADWRVRLPFLVAAGFSTIAWLLVLFRLPESLPKDLNERRPARTAGLSELVRTLSKPKIRGLVALSTTAVLAFSAVESTFSLFLKDRFGWSAQQASFGFTYLGLMFAIVQGGLIRPLVKRFGEVRLTLFGLGFASLGYASIALSRDWYWLLPAIFILALGQGLASPSLQGLISRATPQDEQGGVFGTLSSAQTLARMVNYLLASFLLSRFGSATPLWEACVFALMALLGAFGVLGWASNKNLEDWADFSGTARIDKESVSR